jgi:hypothetical protein
MRWCSISHYDDCAWQFYVGYFKIARIKNFEYPHHKQIVHILNTLLWLLHNVYMYWNITQYPINMYNYNVSSKNKTK